MTSPPTPEAPIRLPLGHGLALAVAVFLTRVPFLSPGFGTDTDTWKLASAAREIARTGHYTSSRTPGYPLIEWSSAPLVGFGAWAPNALSAIAAAACAWLAARLFARHGVRDAWLAGAAFVFVPAAYIAGTSSIDYLWAMAFVLAAWLDATDGRPERAGLWLGLAVASRITSALFVAPLAWLAWNADRDGRLLRAARLAAIGALVGAACYVPTFLRYRWSMFTYSEIQGGQSSALHFLGGMLHPGDPGVAWPLIAGQATVLLWGALGAAAVALALFSIPWQPRAAARAARVTPAAWLALGSSVVAEWILYLRLPHDEGYLIPTVPLLMLALAAWLTPTRFRALCVALLASPFVFGVDVTPPKKGLSPVPVAAWHMHVGRETVVIEPLRGPVLRDLAKRKRMQEVAERVQAWWPHRPASFELAAGNMVPMLYYLFPQDPRHLPYARSYTAEELARAAAQGTPVYALPDVVNRMRINEGSGAAHGLVPLAAPEGER